MKAGWDGEVQEYILQGQQGGGFGMTCHSKAAKETLDSLRVPSLYWTRAGRKHEHIRYGNFIKDAVVIWRTKFTMLNLGALMRREGLLFVRFLLFFFCVTFSVGRERSATERNSAGITTGRQQQKPRQPQTRLVDSFRLLSIPQTNTPRHPRTGQRDQRRFLR